MVDVGSCVDDLVGDSVVVAAGVACGDDVDIGVLLLMVVSLVLSLLLMLVAA